MSILKPGVNKDRVTTLLIALLLITILLVFYRYYPSPPFSPDSWSYFELAKSYDDNFYKITTWRQYQFDNGYGVSFPPLWPLLLWLTDSLLNTGIYSGFILNIFIAIATLFMLLYIAKDEFGQLLPGAVIFSILMLTPFYQNELVAARSIPFAILLILLLVPLSCKDSVGSLTMFIIGIVSGMIVLTRFDFLLPGIFLGISLLFRFQDKRIIFYFLAFFLAISPWCYYSLSTFGKIFVSDNSRTVLATIPTFVTDYYPGTLPTVFNNPMAWLLKTIKNVGSVANGFLKASIYVIIPLGIMWYYQQRYIKKVCLKEFFQRPHQEVRHIFYALLLQVLCIALTGYGDTRYFLALLIFIVLLFIRRLYSLNTEPNEYLKLRKILLLIGAFLCLAVSMSNIAVIGWESYKNKRTFNYSNITATYYSNLIDIIENNEKNPRVLFWEPAMAAKFGALTGINSFLKPENLSQTNFKDFIQHYNINIIVIPKKEIPDLITQNYKYEFYSTSDFGIIKLQ